MATKLFKYEHGGFVFCCILGTLMHFFYEWSGDLTIDRNIMPRKRKRVGAFKDDFLSVYILGNCRILYIQRAHPACFFKALRRTPRNDGNACRALYLHWRKRKRKHGGGYNFIRFGYRRSIRRKLFNNEKPHKENRLCESISIICTVIICLLFTIFTFMPPLTPLFKDATNGTYGI